MPLIFPPQDKLTTLSRLSEIKGSLHSGNQTLNANEAVLFSRGSRTYVAVNNEQADFAANRDLIANLTGITLNVGELKAGTIAVARYFV